jgi:hypothetical protein
MIPAYPFAARLQPFSNTQPRVRYNIAELLLLPKLGAAVNIVTFLLS